jgi:hypothetical protein
LAINFLYALFSFLDARQLVQPKKKRRRATRTKKDGVGKAFKEQREKEREKGQEQLSERLLLLLLGGSFVSL